MSAPTETRHRYSDTLRKVAPILAELPEGFDVLRTLAQFERWCDGRDSANLNTAEAVHYVGTLWHGGQWCPWYAAQCATGFRPGACWSRPERQSMEAETAAAVVRIVASRVRSARRAAR